MLAGGGCIEICALRSACVLSYCIGPECCRVSSPPASNGSQDPVINYFLLRLGHDVGTRQEGDCADPVKDQRVAASS
jgi:hypothetical protein